MSLYSQIRRAGLPSIYVYAAPENLPLVNVTAGTIAFVESIAGLFIYSNGWRPLNTSSDGPVINAAPLSITVESGTTYTTTIDATDPDDLPVAYSVTTTGSIAENTEVAIDETTGVLTVLSNNPYSDNFSIVLTVSDGVFATTRTIPVTITNRAPSFTLEPAASLSATVGTEFSYQYNFTDPDDSTVFTTSIDESLTSSFINFQLMQTINANPAFESLNGYHAEFCSTGDDYLLSVPWPSSPESGIAVYKFDTIENKFKIFQTGLSGELTPSASMTFGATAINKDFIFIADYDEGTTNTTGKILKYNADTDSFISWAGGNLGTIISNIPVDGTALLGDWTTTIKQSAIFAETDDGIPALIVAHNMLSSVASKGYLWLFVYDSVNDIWIYKTRYAHANSTPDLQIIADDGSATYSLNDILSIILNEERKSEFAVNSPAATTVWTITADDPETDLATRTYSLNHSAVAADAYGAGRVTNSTPLNARLWDGEGAFFESENSLWITNEYGQIFNIVRGTPDSLNNSEWITSADVSDGTAVMTNYHNTVNWSGIALNSSKLIVNSDTGMLSRYVFTLDTGTETTTYNNNFSTFDDFVTFRGARNENNITPLSDEYNALWNYKHNLTILCNPGGSVRGNIWVFGKGIKNTIDADGTVSAIPRSYGTYNITSTVSDSIDTISDVVQVSVPDRVSFTQVPPSSKTISADASQTFDTEVISGNYNTDGAVLKFSSDLEHVLSTTLTNATDAVIFDNKLFTVENGAVYYYDIDSFGNIGNTASTLDIASYVNTYTPIVGLEATENFLILKRKNNTTTNTADTGWIEKPFRNMVWTYSVDGLGRITGIATERNEHSLIDLAQDDTDGTKFVNLKWDYLIDSGGQNKEDFNISLKKYIPRENRVTELVAPISLPAPPQASNEYEEVQFFRTYHREYDGPEGTGVGYWAWRNRDDGKHYIYKLEYDNSNITSTLLASRTSGSLNYGGGGGACASSPDGKWLVDTYSTGNNNSEIWLYGPDSEGVNQIWTLTQVYSNNGDKTLCAGFVKIQNQWRLITVNLNNFNYVVQLWDQPSAAGDTLTASTKFTTADSNILGAIGGDYTKNIIIVGNSVFSFNVLTEAFTKLTELSQVTLNPNHGQILEYEPNLDAMVYYGLATPNGSAGATYNLNSNQIFTVNAVTGADTLLGSSSVTAGSGIGGFYATTGVNRYGDTFSVAPSGKNPTTSDYNQSRFWGGKYYHGSLFGPGCLLMFEKQGDDYVYHSQIQHDFDNRGNACLNHEVGDIIEYRGTANDKTYLYIGYPWAYPDNLSSVESYAQGFVYLYEYDVDSAQWVLSSAYEDDYSGDYSQLDEIRSIQSNSFGHSIGRYSNALYEAGPKTLYDDNFGDERFDNPVNVIALIDNRIFLPRTAKYESPGTNLSYNRDRYQSEFDGYAKNIVAKTYVAWFNGEQISIWQPSSNIPSLTLENYSTYIPTDFQTENTQVFYAPTGFDNGRQFSSGQWAYTTFDTDNPMKIWDHTGSWTIEFHYKHTDSGVSYIFNAISFTNNFSTANRPGICVEIRNTTLYVVRNYKGTIPSPVPGVTFNAVPQDGLWHHYAVVYNDATGDIACWRDGTRVGVATSGDLPAVFYPGGGGNNNYYYSIGNARHNTDNTNSGSTRTFSIANLIITTAAEYDTGDLTIDLSAYRGNVYDKIGPNTWGAFVIGDDARFDRTTTTKYDYDIRSFVGGTADAPDIYEPLNIDTADWTRYSDGNDSTIACANESTLFIFQRGSDNLFEFDQVIQNLGTITDVKVADNQVDTIFVNTDTGIKVINRRLGDFLATPINYSTGTVTLTPKLLSSGNFNLKTIGSDTLNTTIALTNITQTSVLDYSAITNQAINVEWGSTDTKTLPVSGTYDTTWHIGYEDSTLSTSQVTLTDNGANYSISVTPDTVTHDKFTVNLDLEIQNERTSVADYTYYTYAPWKLGPFDEYDLEGGTGQGFRRLTPVLDGNDASDQSNYFGYSLSLSEIDQPDTTGYLVVGQPRSNYDDTGTRTDTGEVYVYQWTLDSPGDPRFTASPQRLQENNPFGSDLNNQGQHFGWAVDITENGETLVVTAPGIGTSSVDPTQNSSAAPGAFVYARQADGTFTTSQIIDFNTDLTLPADSQMGTATAISSTGNTIVFSSYNYNTDNNGLVTVYRNDSGTYQSVALIDHISNSWPAQSFTGQDVAVSGDGSVVIFGQPYPSGEGNVKIYVYQNNTYTLFQTLTASDGATGNEFGYSVDITPDGSTIVIGAPGFNSSRGKVYVFNGDSVSGYTETTGLICGDTDYYIADARMGHSVTIDKFASTIVAGAPKLASRANLGVSDWFVGRVVTFYDDSGTWTFSNAYIPNQLDDSHRNGGTFWYNRTYGYAVKLSPNGNQLAVGNPTLPDSAGVSTAPEEVFYHQPDRVRLRQDIIDLNASVIDTVLYASGTLSTVNITAGGPDVVINLPDLWPVGIDTTDNYSIGSTTNVDGVSVSATINTVNNTLVVSHTVDAASLSGPSSTIEIVPPDNTRSQTTLPGTSIRFNWT